MQTLTQLADAARAVIAADRDGELTDDMINALEEALNGAEQSPATEQSRASGLYAIHYRDNWDGEGDTYHLLAEFKEGKWHAEDTGKELLQYEGDAILRAWPLFEDQPTPATEQSGEAVAFDIYRHDGVFVRTIRASDRERLKYYRTSIGWIVEPLYTRPQPAPAVPEAIDLLRTMEWLYKPHDDYSHAQAGYYCPECEEMRESGHRDDCKLLAMLAAAPQPSQQLPAAIEEIAQQWDGCIYDAEGSGLLDIGQSIRDAGKRLMAVPQSSPLAAADGVDALLASAMADVSGHESRAYEKLRKARTMLAAAPQPAQPLPSVIDEIAAERRRQIEVEGWTPGHDDQHRDYALAGAAGCYAMHTLAFPAGDPPQPWPWDKAWWKPSPDKRRNWIKAAALLVAAIEREDRMAAQKEGGE